ncbi:MAG TPA: DcaP family trimeric outer membrane transporter [Candidatus Acidoferrales bacterium]|nr:DcaP family trimeric outer membrane transporter [Candidatus Acidoferrales bacterium]
MARLLLLGAAFFVSGAMVAKAQTTNMAGLDSEKTATDTTGTNAGSGVLFTLPTVPTVGNPSPVADRDNLNDQQVPAPRPGNETLDPKYRGFFPIPNTPVIVMFNAKPRVDMMEDNRNSGNGDRFVTATIPVQGVPGNGYGGGAQFNMNAKGSQLKVDVRAPDLPGNLRFYYQNDFYGSGSAAMNYRLQQLYGEFFNITAGFTYSIFEDPDVWPDTVDYEGPNSAIFARQATVRYMLPLGDAWQLNFGVQEPSSQIDTAGTTFGVTATPVNHLPDGGMNIRWENAKWGHVQLATILRDLGANSTTVGHQNVLGWGFNLSTSLSVFGHDSVQAQLTGGKGIFNFCNDNFTYTNPDGGFNGGDASYNSAGQLRAMVYVAPMLGYTHQWSDKWRSTATFGYVNLSNEPDETAAAYHETYYGSLNVVWQIRKRLSIGLEGLYGYKDQKNGLYGDVWRIQTGLVYSLF